MEHWMAADESRFEGFEILTTLYKHVGSHGITVDLLIPKALYTANPNPLPVLLRYHGGGFIAGSSLFPGHFAPWILELAKQHSAIIVSPNYRLLPESSMKDIMQDLEDSWNWVQASMNPYLSKETGGTIKADLGRIMTAGDSAGGYLSLQLGLSHPESIRAVTAAYPGIDMMASQFTGGTYKQVLGLDPVPADLIEKHMAEVEAARARGEQVIVSSDPKMERAPMMLSAVQYGQNGRFFPVHETSLLPLERISNGARFPQGGVVIWHGKDDTVVPVDGSYRLKLLIEEVEPELSFRLVVRDGDHGFDAGSHANELWIEDALREVVKSWLGDS